MLIYGLKFLNKYAWHIFKYLGYRKQSLIRLIEGRIGSRNSEK